MEAICSSQKLFGGVFTSDKRYERAVVVPDLSREREVSGHTRSVEISDVQSEAESQRALHVQEDRAIIIWTIYPAHSSEGIINA